ncbi:pilin [Pleionea sp. CnH1-48]|nr:pilin [Pleionea sp. CnH1-48]
MAGSLKDKVTQYYTEHLSFPTDNKMSGIPEEKLLIGNRISGVKVENGAIHITLGHKASKILHGKVLTFRPAVVTGSPTSPITWLCGYDEPVPGMEAVGDNKTNLDNVHLSASCRKKS